MLHIPYHPVLPPLAAFMPEAEPRQFVFISRKACLHSNTNSIAFIKIIDIHSLCRDARGLEKLNNCVKEGRFGYLDSQHDLHVHAKNAQALRHRKIAVADKTQSADINQSVDSTSQLVRAINTVTAIDEAEYASLAATLDQIIAQVRQQQEATKEEHRVSHAHVTAPVQSQAVNFSDIEKLFLCQMCDIIKRVQAQISEQNAIEKKRIEEKKLQDILKQDEIKSTCVFKQRLAAEFLAYVLKKVAVQVQEYHWALLHPQQPSAAAIPLPNHS